MSEAEGPTVPGTQAVAFLQWALPRLHLRWPGFRKVRRQVVKRIRRRLAELQLPDLDAYRDYLELHEDEWPRLDAFCRISISRFYRDRDVFCLKASYRGHVSLLKQDIRHEAPERLFQLVLCRHLVFTYFDVELQRAVLPQITTRLAPGGFLVTAKKETLPVETKGLIPWKDRLGIHQRCSD